MLKTFFGLLLIQLSLSFCNVAVGQHCAPIGSSYLSKISFKSLRQGEISLEAEYLKTGGRRKESYQIYLLAYLEKDAASLPTPPKENQRARYGDELFSEEISFVLDTSIVKRDFDGFYQYNFTKNSTELATLFETKLMAKIEKKIDGGWGRYEEQIRLAIFIPFLEDTRYANLKGLPEDRHECNYSNDRALLWQELPYRISVHFYESTLDDKKPGKPYIQINGGQRKSPSY
ncbi:MAG: hypothetical protein AAF939_04325 [Planctomycetota bacterium]